MQQTADQSANLAAMLLGNVCDAFNDLPENLAVANRSTWPTIRIWARNFARHFVSPSCNHLLLTLESFLAFYRMPIFAIPCR